eukprot:5693341-Pyramimonas_sp.AAC.1
MGTWAARGRSISGTQAKVPPPPSMLMLVPAMLETLVTRVAMFFDCYFERMKRRVKEYSKSRLQ